MKEVRADESLHPQRLRIEIDGEVRACGSITNIGVVMRSLMHPRAIVYVHPDAEESFRQFQIDDGKRRPN